MDINVLDTNFNIVDVLDVYESLLWNVKYNAVGDFELVVPISGSLNNLQMDYYIEIPTSDRTMIIEHQEPVTDVEEGHTVKFSGRSLESILDRRIVWQQTTISGNLHNAIKSLLTDAIINPSIADRKIANFIFEDSTDTDVTSKTVTECQFTGDNLLEVISSLCLDAKIGFQITLNQSNQFVFKLYSGKNRTTDQNTYPQVEFSPNNDNLFSCVVTKDKKNYKNVTLVAGEGEGAERKTAAYGSASGLDRRELFTDARDISSNEGTESAISTSDYTQLLQTRGQQKLAEMIITNKVDAKVDTSERAMFKYQTDYFMGDLVENVDIYGVHSKSRITEMTIVLDQNGYSSYPIFETEGE